MTMSLHTTTGKRGLFDDLAGIFEAASLAVTAETDPSQILQGCSSILVQFAQDDSTALRASLSACLAYLIADMAAGTSVGGDYVTAPTVTATVAAVGANASDMILAATVVRGDGQTQQNAFDEVIQAQVVDDTNQATPSVLLQGALSQPTSSISWPAGSGLSTSLAATDPSQGLLTNGTFETWTTANVPDGWIPAVAVPGTTLKLTAPEVQTVTISGAPEGGFFVLNWVDGNGHNRSSGTLAYNASASVVQTALRAIAGLEAITVTSVVGATTVYTVTFAGVPGNPAQLTSGNYLSGGTSPSISHATTNAADANSYRGTSVIFTGNATELTEISQQLPTLSRDTVYFLTFRIRASGTISAGTLIVEIADGINGSATTDSAGGTNRLTVDLTGVSTSAAEPQVLTFRLAQAVVQPVYLRVRLSVAMTSATKIYMDEFTLVPGRELYAGGPVVALVSGVATSVVGQAWTITVANDYGGKFQQWFDRAFQMRVQGLLLPTAGDTLIDDTLIQ